MKIVVTLMFFLLVCSPGNVEQALGIHRSICGNRCHIRKLKAFRECFRTGRTRRLCHVKQCRRRGRRGRKCVRRRRPRPTPTRTSTPTPTPTSSPSLSPSSSPTPTPTPTPTSSPSLSPSSSPTPTPTQRVVGPPKTGFCWGDPHIMTFDKLGYDCQAQGEFILARNSPPSSPGFEVQARFVKTNSRFSLSSGIAALEEGAPLIQFSVARRLATTSVVTISGCRIVIYVNGETMTFGAGEHVVGGNTRITVTSSSLRADFPSGMRIHVAVSSFFFGNMVVTIPGLTISSGPIVGLLGTPNGNPNDDWTTRSGDPLPISSDLRGGSADRFCAENWGIRSQEQSLFTLEEGDTFEGADEFARGGAPNLDDAPEEVVAICGDNEECLIDGILADAEFARMTLRDQRDAEEIAEEDLMPAMSEAPDRMLVTALNSRTIKTRHEYFYSTEET